VTSEKAPQRGAWLARPAGAGPAALRVWTVPIVLCLGSSLAWGLTAPRPGAVALPAGLELRLPFVSGEEIATSSGYGPTTGSALHYNTDQALQPNDYYALDLVLPRHPSNGRGQPVVAAFAGTVVAAGWSRGSWASYGQRVVVQRRHSDGHVYNAVYAHLNRVAVSAGQQVAQGEVLGELGGSCAGDQQQLECPSFAPHLHWALHRDSQLEGEGASSVGGNAVVPEPIDGYQDLAQGQTLFAGGVAPAADCPAVPPQGTTLEDDGPCFHRHGPPHYWQSTAAGRGDHAFYAFITAAAAAENWGQWELQLAAAGRYALRVYIPASVGQSLRATYVVRHAGQDTRVAASQGAVKDAWLSLGRFDFATGGDQGVSLADDTGEATTTKLAFDALEIAPATPGGDAGLAARADAGVAADATRDAADGGTTKRQTDGGCNSAHGATGGGIEPVLLLALLGLVRRRRQRWRP